MLVDRWTHWADRIRRRHSRRDRGAVHQSMVLAHRGATTWTARFINNRRTIIELHAHVGVMSVPSPAMLLRGETASRASAGAGPGLRTTGGRADWGAKPSRERSGSERPTVAGGFAFVRPDAGPGQVLRRSARRRSLAIDGAAASSDARIAAMPVLSLRRGPTLTAAHADLPGRLRRRSTREEMAIPGRTTVLARSAAQPSAAPQRDVADREEIVTSRSVWPVPAPSPVNVEALTSQVIQQIDRRLLAYRERMGRV